MLWTNIPVRIGYPKTKALNKKQRLAWAHWTIDKGLICSNDGNWWELWIKTIWNETRPTERILIALVRSITFAFKRGKKLLLYILLNGEQKKYKAFAIKMSEKSAAASWETSKKKTQMKFIEIRQCSESASIWSFCYGRFFPQCVIWLFLCVTMHSTQG